MQYLLLNKLVLNLYCWDIKFWCPSSFFWFGAKSKSDIVNIHQNREYGKVHVIRYPVPVNEVIDHYSSLASVEPIPLPPFPGSSLFCILKYRSSNIMQAIKVHVDGLIFSIYKYEGFQGTQKMEVKY